MKTVERSRLDDIHDKRQNSYLHGPEPTAPRTYTAYLPGARCRSFLLSGEDDLSKLGSVCIAASWSSPATVPELTMQQSFDGGRFAAAVLEIEEQFSFFTADVNIELQRSATHNEFNLCQ